MKRVGFFMSFLLLALLVGHAYANLIENGGFEDGLSGWTAINAEVKGPWGASATTQRIDPVTGSSMAVLAPGDESFPLGQGDAALLQSFLPGGYTSVTISFDFNLQALDTTWRAEAGPDSLIAIVVDVSDRQVYGGSIPFNDPHDGLGKPQTSSVYGWTHIETTATEPAGFAAGTFVISFLLRNSEGTGGDPGQYFSAYLDNVSIEGINPIPEPGTMLLLGSGLAGLAGFRRWRQRKEG